MNEQKIVVSRVIGTRERRLGLLPARFVDPSQLPPPAPCVAPERRRAATAAAVVAAGALLTGCVTVQLPPPPQPIHTDMPRLMYVRVEMPEQAELVQVDYLNDAPEVDTIQEEAPAPAIQLPEEVVRMPPAPVAVPVLPPAPPVTPITPPAHLRIPAVAAATTLLNGDEVAATTMFLGGLVLFTVCAIRARRRDCWAELHRRLTHAGNVVRIRAHILNRRLAGGLGLSILATAWGAVVLGGVFAEWSAMGWV